MYLIKNEDLNFRNNKFLIKCLKKACEGNHIDICEVIINHRNTIEKFSYYEQNQIVIDACSLGNFGIFQFYLEKTTNIFYPSLMYLSESCKSGNMSLVKHVLDDCNESSQLSISDFHDFHDFQDFHNFFQNACTSGNIEIVNLLIENGCNNWNRGLHGVCQGCGDNVEIAEFMIQKGVTSFYNCLFEACLAGNIKIVNLLIDNGVTDWDDGMYGACVGNHMNLVKFMIEKGAENWNGKRLYQHT